VCLIRKSGASSRDIGDADLVSELLKLMHGAVLRLDRIEPDEVVRAGVGIAFSVGKHVPDRRQNRVLKRDESFIGPRRAAMRLNFAAR
jgi:hypothetical protein